MKNTVKKNKRNPIVSFILKHWFFTLVVLDTTIFCIRAHIAYESMPRNANSVIYYEMNKYLQGNKDNIESLLKRLFEISPEIEIGIVEYINHNHHEMHFAYDWCLNDTSKYRSEVFILYSKCFNINPIRELGPVVRCENEIARISRVSYSFNYCDEPLDYIYTKLDTITLKSRFSELPFFNKETQPRDSECNFIWEIGDYWYLISD